MISLVWLGPIISALLFLFVYFLSHHFHKQAARSTVASFAEKDISLSNTHYPNARKFVYLIGFIWVLFAIFFGWFYFEGVYFISFEVRFFGIGALIWFFLTLMPGLLRVYFPFLNLNSLFIFCRKPLGIVTCVFALIHALLAFVYYFDGNINTFLVLSNVAKGALILGSTALFILLLLMITSFDFMVHSLNFSWWKRLHRFIYFSILFATLHAFLRGTSFKGQLFGYGMGIFITSFVLLELGATAEMIWRNKRGNMNWRILFSLGSLFLIGIYVLYLNYLIAKNILLT